MPYCSISMVFCISFALQMELSNVLSCMGFIANVWKAFDNESPVGDYTTTK